MIARCVALLALLSAALAGAAALTTGAPLVEVVARRTITLGAAEGSWSHARAIAELERHRISPGDATR